MSDTQVIRSLTGSDRLGRSKRASFVQTSIGFSATLFIYTIAIGLLLPGTRLGLIASAVAALSYALIALWASKSATLQAPIYAFVVIGLSCMTAGAFVNGGADGYTASFFVTVPIISAYFLGARGAMVTGAAALLCAIGLTIADINGLVVETPYEKSLISITGCLILATSIALTTIAARSFSRRAAAHTASIEQSNALLSAFARTAPIAVAMFDRDLRYIEASDRWIADYGLDRDRVIGRTHYEVFPEIPQRWKDIHKRCLAGATERSECDLFVRADGTEQWVLWEVQPWRDARGAIGGIIMISRDITEQVRSQLSLRAQKRQAIDSSTAKSAFVAAINDKMKAPLGALGDAVAALLATPLDARQRTLAAEAIEAGARLHALIADMVDLSRFEAPKAKIGLQEEDAKRVAAGSSSSA